MELESHYAFTSRESQISYPRTSVYTLYITLLFHIFRFIYLLIYYVIVCTYALRGTGERVLVADLSGIGLVRLSFEQIRYRTFGTVTVDGL